MPKLRKLRRKQKFRYDRNRKRIKKSQESTRNKNIKVSCDVMKANWDNSKPMKQNMAEMGLAYDANKSISTTSTKQQLIQKAKESKNKDEGSESLSPDKKAKKKSSTKVVKQLEEDLKKVPIRQTFRFPKEQVRFITYMMNKHGDDFKAMARDPKNVFQLTPKQIRQKVVKFISIPEQLSAAAKEHGWYSD